MEQGLEEPVQKHRLKVTRSREAAAGARQVRWLGEDEEKRVLTLWRTLFPEKYPQCTPSMNIPLCIQCRGSWRLQTQPETQIETPQPHARYEEQRVKGRVYSINI